MPAHDWTKVSQGILHDFHNSWVVALRNALNSGLLPPGYYALTEQVTGGAAPDLIALELVPRSERRTAAEGHGPGQHAGSAVLTPPRATIVARAESPSYASLRKTVVIRHSSSHEVVALIEIISRANKASRAELERFLTKAQSALKQHVHLLVVDVHPPGRLDPQGIHGALWAALAQPPPDLPRDRPLLAAAYEADIEITAYVEPFRVGEQLPEMPLFLGDEGHVPLPLEPSYMEAFRGVPSYWRERVERVEAG
ncbi:MAG: DUF4058 family protein [Planctomycetes bacterium]|nr:DUF4058 family protein [Planctomycetota bacterium]